MIWAGFFCVLGLSLPWGVQDVLPSAAESAASPGLAKFTLQYRYYLFSACVYDWTGSRVLCASYDDFWASSSQGSPIKICDAQTGTTNCVLNMVSFCDELQSAVATARAMAVLSVLWCCFALGSYAFKTCDVAQDCWDCCGASYRGVQYTIVAIIWTATACAMTQKVYSTQMGKAPGGCPMDGSACFTTTNYDRCRPPVSSLPNGSSGAGQWMFLLAALFQIAAVVVSFVMPDTLCSTSNIPSVPTSFGSDSD